MSVKRIVADIATPNPAGADRFYGEILGLERLMDQGWIITYGSPNEARVQISFCAEGGSGIPVPDLSIEVEDVDATYEQMVAAEYAVEYGPVNEPWGVRRFYVRDPFGKLVNVLAHQA